MKLFSKPILKQSIKGNIKLWSILTAVLSFFMIVMTVSFLNIKDRAAQGGGGGGAGGGFGNMTLTGLYSNALYNMMGIVIIMIYCIIVGNKLVASEVDKGTMAYSLNTPITRMQLVLSKLAYFVGSIFAMVAMMTVVGLGASAIFAPGELDVGAFLLLNLGLLMYGLAVGGISYFASCWFNRSGLSMAVGAGIPLASFVLNSLSGLEGFEFFKYFSINTLFDVSNIVAKTDFVIQFIALFVIGVVFYIVGINKFNKKDLPL